MLPISNQGLEPHFISQIDLSNIMLQCTVCSHQFIFVLKHSNKHVTNPSCPQCHKNISFLVFFNNQQLGQYQKRKWVLNESPNTYYTTTTLFLETAKKIDARKKAEQRAYDQQHPYDEIKGYVIDYTAKAVRVLKVVDIQYFDTWVPKSSLICNENLPRNELQTIKITRYRAKPGFWKVVSSETAKELLAPEKTSFYGIILFSPSIYTRTKFYLIWSPDLKGYTWVNPDIASEFTKTQQTSPYNATPLYFFRFSRNGYQALLIRLKPTSDVIAEYFFDIPEKPSYILLRSRILALSKKLQTYLSGVTTKEHYRPFTLKNLKKMLGMENIEDSSYCLCCKIYLDNPKDIVCYECLNDLQEEISVHKDKAIGTYLPKPLFKDPYEIKFETTGIKYRNRRYKWR